MDDKQFTPDELRLLEQLLLNASVRLQEAHVFISLLQKIQRLLQQTQG